MTMRNKSTWKEDACFRMQCKWLHYSTRIALRVKAALEIKQLSRADLAKELGVKDQWINDVVNGKENLTLESIYALSEKLGVELISFPEFKYSEPLIPTVSFMHRNAEFTGVLKKAHSEKPLSI